MKISGRLTIALLAAALVPLLVAGLWSLYSLNETMSASERALEQTNAFAVERSREELTGLGESLIEEKAEAVVKQLELYLAANPALATGDPALLQADPGLRAIALQPVGETGYTALLDRQGIIHVHTNPAMVGVPISTLAADYPEFWDVFAPALAGAPSQGYYDWPDADGQVRDKYASIKLVADSPLLLAATTYIDEFSQPAGQVESQLLARQDAVRATLAAEQRRALTRLLGILLATLALVGVAAYRFSQHICRPVVQMVGAATQIAAGDLSIEPPDTRVGELGLLSAAFGQISANLSALLRQVQGLTVSLSTAAAQVVRTQRQHAADSQEQVHAVTNACAAVEQLAASSASIAVTARQVFDAAQQTHAGAQQGSTAMAEARLLLQRIATGNDLAVGQVRHLGDLAHQIGLVMGLIEDIAAQTRLIAFNASIEAAAGGETGRRFAVVAGEVRRLAGDVAHSATEIRAKVAEIQSTTNELVIASERESKEIGAGIAAGETTATVLSQILASAEETTLAGQQISLSTQQQRSATEQLLEDLQSLITGAQAVAAGSIETVNVMNGLVQMAEELNGSVDTFRLPELPAANGGDGDPVGSAPAVLRQP